MKKRWMLKYVLTILSGIIVAVLLYSLPVWRVRPPWYIWLMPLFALSLLMVWRVIRRYVTLALDKVEVGDRAYTLLFRCILIVGGILLLLPLMCIGFILAILHMVKEYTLARDEYEATRAGEASGSQQPATSDDERADIVPAKSKRTRRKQLQIAGKNDESDTEQVVTADESDDVIQLTNPSISNGENDTQEEP